VALTILKQLLVWLPSMAEKVGLNKISPIRSRLSDSLGKVTC